MKIALVTPAAAATRHGNWNTAARWARLLRLLWRAESDPGYYRLLKAQCRARRHLSPWGASGKACAGCLPNSRHAQSHARRAETA